MTAAGPRRSGRSGLGGLLLVVALAAAVLHAAGGGGLSAPSLARPASWGLWLSQRDPVVAAMALVRLGAVAMCWYVLSMGSVGLVLRRLRARRLVSVADRFTLPALRRLLASAAGVTLAAGVSPSFALVSGPQLPAAVAPPAPFHAAAAGQLDTTTTTTITGSVDEPARPPPTLTMRLLPGEGAGGTGPVPAPPATASTQTAPAPGEADTGARTADRGTWRVRPGDCFWSIAEEVLAKARGRPVSDAEVVPYWRALIEANRDALGDRSNPNLIFPGQVFTVPEPPVTGR